MRCSREALLGRAGATPWGAYSGLAFAVADASTCSGGKGEARSFSFLSLTSPALSVTVFNLGGHTWSP